MILDFFNVDNFDFTRKIVKQNSWKCWGFVKIEFLDKNLTFRMVCLENLFAPSKCIQLRKCRLSASQFSSTVNVVGSIFEWGTLAEIADTDYGLLSFFLCLDFYHWLVLFTFPFPFVSQDFFLLQFLLNFNDVQFQIALENSQCLKINPKCSILIFEFWHFPPMFDLLKLACLVTLFDRKL